MMAHLTGSTYTDRLEYHGNTAVERVRERRGVALLREWILFDTVEEAQAFFNASCCPEPGAVH